MGIPVPAGSEPVVISGATPGAAGLADGNGGYTQDGQVVAEPRSFDRSGHHPVSDRMDQLAIQNGPGRQVALVTGASSGIGRATATSLAGRGWNVVLIARAHAGLADVERECAAAGATVLAVEADVSSHRDVEAAFQEAVAKFGRIHAVVQCAAVVAYGRFEDIPAEIFDQAISTNIVGPANVARAALRHFQQFGAGRLVILGSLLGKIAVPFMSPYVTSKWGVHALTRMLQIEARQTPGIRITLVSPGSVNTPAYSQAANYVGREGRPPPPVDPPEKVAEAIIRALHESRREISVGLANHVVVLGFRLLPAVYDALVSPLMKVAGLSRRPIDPHPGTVLAPAPEGDAVHGVWSRLGFRRVNSTATAKPALRAPSSTVAPLSDVGRS